MGEWIKKFSLLRTVCHTGIIASAPFLSPSSTSEATTQQEENNYKKKPLNKKKVLVVALVGKNNGKEKRQLSICEFV